MNKRLTLFLAIVATVLGLLTLLTQKKYRSDMRSGSRSQSVLRIPANQMLRIEVKTDYWNSFSLERDESGKWALVEPSREAADESAVNRLIDNLSDLPILAEFDSPVDDTERYQQYGLWSPRGEILVMTADEEVLLQFGSDSAMPAGVYCATNRDDKIHVISTDAFETLVAPLDHYRLKRSPPQE
ncbi:MAG: hypothetical protein C4527_16410 [Candidatus Omnitrophota bacterium]|nr:MAG: hypothetical protein C4527_16410 [Candidatus Omnitrophota bacterium]